MKIQTFTRQLGIIEQHARIGRILDIGCATGFFLEAAEKRGWEVFGVELSDYAASVAQARFGSRVFHGTLEQAAYPANHFHAIAMSDLIEHIPEPLGFLTEVRRILAPNGVIAIQTPDVDSLSARLMGRQWTHFKMEHLYYYSNRTLSQLLEKLGFQVLQRGAAVKAVSLTYVRDQFRVYRNPILTPLAELSVRVLPLSLATRPFYMRLGECFVVARQRG